MAQFIKFITQYTCSDAGSGSSKMSDLMAHVLKKNAQHATLVQCIRHHLAVSLVHIQCDYGGRQGGLACAFVPAKHKELVLKVSL